MELLNPRSFRRFSTLAAFSVLLIVALPPLTDGKRYTPDWDSLDSRPLPAWYDDAKIGIFIHWGVFSVPSFDNEWFWYKWKGPRPDPKFVKFMKDNYKPDFTYADFAKDLTTELFDPNHWADVFKASGARYVVQVTKHHEGYTSWPSKRSFSWNSMDVGPKRDLVGELATAVRNRTNLHYGTYHSMKEWFNPLYIEDLANHCNTQDFVLFKTLPELYELVNAYKPDIVWSDGPTGCDDTYWNSTSFLAWLYNDSPVKDTVVVNDRWGNNCPCKHGGFYTCGDRYNPKVKQNHKWENAMTLYDSGWNYRREATLSDVLTIEVLLTTIAETVSCGGNILINFGPTKEGTITPIFEERFRQLGSWLDVNGEGIYKTQPWTYQNDTSNPNVWYTGSKSTPSTVYAIVLKWPNEKLVLDAPKVTEKTVITLLGYEGKINYEAEEQHLFVDIPKISLNDMPCLWAWVFKMTNIEN